MNVQYVALFVGVLVVAGLILRFSLWRAILFFSPTSIRIDVEDQGRVEVPEALRPTVALLEQAGFAPLGTHSERPVLGPVTLCFDFVSAQDRTWATVFMGRDDVPAVYFLSVLEEGGLVLTSNYRRPAREEPGRYVSGWLEDIPADRVFKAHMRRLEGAALSSALSLEERVDVARQWYSDAGKSEVRQQHVQGLLWSLGSLGMVAAAIFGRR